MAPEHPATLPNPASGARPTGSLAWLGLVSAGGRVSPQRGGDPARHRLGSRMRGTERCAASWRHLGGRRTTPAYGTRAEAPEPTVSTDDRHEDAPRPSVQRERASEGVVAVGTGFSFEVVDAEDFETLRPDYAAETAPWVAERGDLGEGSLVVDLAAGTGQLSRRLPSLPRSAGICSNGSGRSAGRSRRRSSSGPVPNRTHRSRSVNDDRQPHTRSAPGARLELATIGLTVRRSAD